MPQLVKSLPAGQETCVQSPNGEDPLEKETATQSSILAWEIPWTEEPGGLPPWDRESDMTYRVNDRQVLDNVLCLIYKFFFKIF